MFFFRKWTRKKKQNRKVDNFKVGFFMGWMIFGGLYALWVAFR